MLENKNRTSQHQSPKYWADVDGKGFTKTYLDGPHLLRLLGDDTTIPGPITCGCDWMTDEEFTEATNAPDVTV